MSGHRLLKEPLIKSFDRLRTNGKSLIPFVVSLSNHERNQLIQSFLNSVIPAQAGIQGFKRIVALLLGSRLRGSDGNFELVL
jgi:hypothetical protein